MGWNWPCPSSGTGRITCSTPRCSSAFRLAVRISLRSICDGDSGLAAGVVAAAVEIAGPYSATYVSYSASLTCS
eukprot:1732583-Pleurochrysis_carterae.AAC.1